MKSAIHTLRGLRPLPAALLLVAALAAPWAQAQTAPAAGQAHHGSAAMKQRTLQAIGATAAQQAQIQAILTQARSDVRQQRKTAGDLRLQLAQVLAAPSVDASAAETARQKILAQQESSSQRMLQARLQVAAVLTPDQRQKLLALNEQQRAKWQGRHRAPVGA